MADEMKREALRVERLGGHIALVTLNRPDARNAIDAAVTADLARTVAELEADDDIWIAILAGAGPHFCAGADLKTVARGEGRLLGTRDGGFAGFTSAARTKVWIAAVEGAALAGGFEIALACDFIVCATTATFGLPEARRGMLAAAGGAYRLPRRLPRPVAMEMIATGEPIEAGRGLALGLVNRVTETGQAVPGALALANSIALSAPLAVREGLALARAADDHDEATLARLSAEANRRLFATADFGEGPRAFVEKRAPVWSGR